MGEGLVSGSFPESESTAHYPKVLLNSPGGGWLGGGGIKDLAKPDGRTLVDATQGGVNRHILLTTQPTRPSLADAVGIMDRLNDPAAENGADSLPTAM